MVAACAKSEVEDSATDGGAVQFTTTSAVTRSVEKKEWELSEAIGVYAATGLYSNIGYEVESIDPDSGEVTFAPVDDAKQIYYSRLDTHQTFYAYYPYNESVTDDIVPIDLSTSQEDVLWSSVSISQNDAKVDFVFDHVLSLIEIEVTAVGDLDALPSDIADMRIFLGGTITNGSLDVCADDIAAGLCLGSETNHIETTIELDNGTYTASAIVMPNDYSTASDDIIIYYEIGDRAFHNEFKPTWESGKKYKYSAAIGSIDVTFTLEEVFDAWDTEVAGDALLSGYDMVITEADLCQIYTAKGLAAFRDLVNGAGSNTESANVQDNSATTYVFGDTKYTTLNAKLMNDIDLSSICYNTSTTWSPISKNSGVLYTGDFDGDGFEVRGLYINASSSNYQGLFGYIYYATIHDLGVSGSVTGNSCVGGLVGQCDGEYNERTTIYNCYSNVTVTGSGMSVGGIGGNCCYTDIYNCYNMGNVKGLGQVGGVVGYIYSSTLFICYSAAIVVATNNPADVGGVVGSVRGSTVSSCYYNSTYYGGAGYGYVDSGTPAITPYSTSEMKSTTDTEASVTFLSTLNTNAASITGIDVCKWKAGSDGYPTLDFGNLANSAD